MIFVANGTFINSPLASLRRCFFCSTMQRYGSFGRWANILRTLDRGCSDRSGVLRQNGGGGGDCVVIGIKNAPRASLQEVRPNINLKNPHL